MYCYHWHNFAIYIILHIYIFFISVLFCLSMSLCLYVLCKGLFCVIRKSVGKIVTKDHQTEKQLDQDSKLWSRLKKMDLYHTHTHTDPLHICEILHNTLPLPLLLSTHCAYFLFLLLFYLSHNMHLDPEFTFPFILSHARMTIKNLWIFELMLFLGNIMFIDIHWWQRCLLSPAVTRKKAVDSWHTQGQPE